LQKKRKKQKKKHTGETPVVHMAGTAMLRKTGAIMASVEERIKAVTARVLRIEAASIKPSDSFSADLGAESVQSIELVANFEEEFGIEMDEDAALSVETVGAAVEFITKVCKEQGVAL
jgi:acyl carrier protein